MKRFLNNLSILKKISLQYSLVVLFPSVLLLLYSYYINFDLTRKEAYKAGMSLFDEVLNNLENHIISTEEIAIELGTQEEIVRFLSKEYHFNASNLKDYRQSVFPIIESATRFKNNTVSGIYIFYTNQTIPEFWSHFFKEERIKDEPWYQDFTLSNDNGIWLYPRQSGIPSKYLQTLPSEISLTYVRKIWDIHQRYQGIIIANIPQSVFFSPLSRLDDGASGFFLFNKEGALLYTSKEPTISGRLNDSGEPVLLPDNFDPRDYQDHDFKNLSGKNKMWISSYLEGIELFLVYSMDMSLFLQPARKTGIISILILLAALFILETFMYFAFSRILRKIKGMTSLMDNVASGDFTIRIPVESNDEIGQIARDFNSIVENLDELMHEKVQERIAQKDAQFRNLQMQINPHFIYNTIETFRMKLVMADQFELADYMALFGGMMRYNMSGITTFSTIREEIQHVERYITIQRLRFDNQIELIQNVEEELYEAAILRFVLQPMVENSLKYGTGENRIRITITIQRKEESIFVSVHDNGMGMSEMILKEMQHKLSERQKGYKYQPQEGVGLINIKSRLSLYYGEKAGISLESRQGGYTEVNFFFPVLKNREEQLD